MRAAPPFRAPGRRFPIDDPADIPVEGVERRHAAMTDFRIAPSDAADLSADVGSLRRQWRPDGCAVGGVAGARAGWVVSLDEAPAGLQGRALLRVQRVG